MLDIALITGYLQLLFGLIFGPRANSLSTVEITLIVCISISIILQIVLLTLITMLYKTVGDNVNRYCSAIAMNYSITTLTSVSVLANIAISILAVYVNIY
jgi:hypothetical protein